jgi:hypothetical protein
VDTYGESYERRPLLMAFISSEENLGRRDVIRSAVERVADPRATSAEEAGRIAAETPIVVWLNYGTDGEESAATEAGLQVAYQLVAGESAEMRRFRDEALIILTPVQNPESHQRFVFWYNAFGIGAEDPLAAEKHPPWAISNDNNHYQIDLNRDATAAASPEASILKNARDAFEPTFGFNLHDQNIYYNTKGSSNPATISVLAPAYNEATDINEVRLNAMKVIAGMNHMLQQQIPGHVGKYDDAFEPRAFGDNFQRWGTSTILIESGGYPGDLEKQYIRKLNFMAILNALYEIATEGYQKYTEEAYFSIPDNDSKMMDLIIRSAKVNKNDHIYTADIGIRRRETNHGDRDYRISGVIEDLGDLSVFYGYEEITGEDLEIVMGKPYGEMLNWDDISDEKSLELLRQGHLAIKIKGAAKGKMHGHPIRVFTEDKAFPSEIGLGGPADFFLSEKGKLRYAIVNGYLVDLQNPSEKIYKHLIE